MGSGQYLRILPFNRHEPYMYELAKTGHEFDLLLVDRTLWKKEWDVQSRPIRTNVEIVGKAENITSLGLWRRFSLSFARAMFVWSPIRVQPGGIGVSRQAISGGET